MKRMTSFLLILVQTRWKTSPRDRRIGFFVSRDRTWLTRFHLHEILELAVWKPCSVQGNVAVASVDSPRDDPSRAGRRLSSQVRMSRSVRHLT